MQIEKSILPGTYPVDIEIKGNGEIVAEIAEGEHKGEKLTLSPIGVTKKSHEESKKRKKIALRSRQINRKR